MVPTPMHPYFILQFYSIVFILVIKKWRIRHTQSLMRRTHPLLRNCRDNAKLAYHCTARYKIEWIYMKTKVRGPDSLELALEMRKKERKIEKWPFF